MLSDDILNIVTSYAPVELLHFLTTNNKSHNWKSLYKILFNEYHIPPPYSLSVLPPTMHHNIWLNAILNRINFYNNSNISCGSDHNFMRLDDGTIVGCGNNRNGELGLGDYYHRFKFTTVDYIKNVKQIACGGNHTIILLNDGTLMSCGDNSSGQLGVNCENTNIFTKVNIDIANVANVTNYDIDNIYNINDVVQIACGGDFTYILLENGNIMSCGDNGWGQLGLNYA